MEKVLEIKGLRKGYGRKVVLDEINLTLEKGKVLGILAPNGEGKTTLLNIIAGLYKKDSGEIKFCNEELSTESKSKISYLYEKNLLNRRMTIEGAKKYYMDFFQDFNEKKFNELLEFMKLEKNMKIKPLSKGMLEKLNLSLTLSREAKLYILDEPISGVDPVTRVKIIDAIIENISEEKTFIITTHYVGELERLFDEVCFIGDGKVVETGNCEDLRIKNSMSIDQLYIKIFGGI